MKEKFEKLCCAHVKCSNQIILSQTFSNIILRGCPQRRPREESPSKVAIHC